MLTGPDAGSFELHQRALDSQGTEKFLKCDKDAVAQKTRILNMAQEVAAECANQTFVERLKWVEETRKQGNVLYSEKKLDDAINVYMTTLCALDFSTCKDKVTEEQSKMASASCKLPVLNNIAQCLFVQGHYDRCIKMVD